MRWHRSLLLAASLLAASGCTSSDSATAKQSVHPTSGTLVLHGDAAGVYTNGTFLLWNPATGGAPSMAATTTQSESDSATQRASRYQGLDVVGEATIDANGQFKAEVFVEDVGGVSFYVLDATSDSGFTLAPTKGLKFILEPGELELKMTSTSDFVVRGGYFNDAVYNSWRLSEPYAVAVQESRKFVGQLKDAEAAEKPFIHEQINAVSGRRIQIERDGHARVAITHPDPRVRRLAIETAWLGGDWMLDAIEGLAVLTPNDPWVQEKLVTFRERQAKVDRERKIDVGTEIIDFAAETLDGETLTLADIRAGATLVLVEFWASWCGPCRVEIPHMKEAYARFKEAGFEIVSFTIDDEREAWVQASEEEQLPWFNLGMGPSAAAALAYSVTGVPVNYLIDGKTGEILAKNLRGFSLEQKLEELL